MRQLRAFGEATRAELLERARQQLANGKPADEVLELLAHGLTNRLLHPPTAALRAAASSRTGPAAATACSILGRE